MAWPTRTEVWGDDLDAVCRSYADVAKAIARFEAVHMVANPDHAARASVYCGPSVGIVAMPIDDSWMRDSGPTFVLNRKQGGVAAVDWIFNAWGGKYQPHDSDAVIAERIIEGLDIPRFVAPLVTEGGAIHTDGDGTLLVTETALLDPNRNPGKTKADIDAIFHDYLGATRVIWLPGSAYEVETNGHIDLIASFTQPGVVLADLSDDPDDPEFDILKENWRALQLAQDARGQAVEMIPLMRPTKLIRVGERFSASYMNYYLVNGGVIVPGFGDVQADAAACDVFRAAFPNREVVQVNILPIAPGGGGIHCITQQQPAPLYAV
jgi:agmatine deiminase